MNKGIWSINQNVKMLSKQNSKCKKKKLSKSSKVCMTTDISLTVIYLLYNVSHCITFD